MKIGRYTPSSAIKIISTKNLLKMMPDLVVILAYLHNQCKKIFLLKKRWKVYDFISKPKRITIKIIKFYK